MGERGADDPMTVRLEAEISPGMSPDEFVELAVRCERAGFDRFGVSDVVFWPDCFVLQGLIAQATSRIHIGSMVTNPYSRHPAMLAGAVATLQELSHGRMFLGIGVGAGLEDLRIDYPRPVRALREAIVGIRGLLSGETVELDGEMFPIDGARLVRPPEVPVPISVGTPQPPGDAPGRGVGRHRPGWGPPLHRRDRAAVPAVGWPRARPEPAETSPTSMSRPA